MPYYISSWSLNLLELDEFSVANKKSSFSLAATLWFQVVQKETSDVKCVRAWHGSSNNFFNELFSDEVMKLNAGQNHVHIESEKSESKNQTWKINLAKAANNMHCFSLIWQESVSILFQISK